MRAAAIDLAARDRVAELPPVRKDGRRVGHAGFAVAVGKRLEALEVARTIADLAGRDIVNHEDVFEGIQYRSLDRQLWG